MNAESSRSHLVFSVLIEYTDLMNKKTNTGKLTLVDLAGSERVGKTGATADRLKEAQSINKSLSALGDVISALSTNQKFIPYRNNILTQLMSDSLGGNAKTLMFVNISPADYNAMETQTSLVYASRVKLITNDANKQSDSEEVAKLRRIIRDLQEGKEVNFDEGVDIDDEGEGEAPVHDFDEGGEEKLTYQDLAGLFKENFGVPMTAWGVLLKVGFGVHFTSQLGVGIAGDFRCEVGCSKRLNMFSITSDFFVPSDQGTIASNCKYRLDFSYRLDFCCIYCKKVISVPQIVLQSVPFSFAKSTPKTTLNANTP